MESIAQEAPLFTGTPSQIEWAELIRPRVAAEFDRVANAFREIAARQPPLAQADTQAILAILEEKRNAVLAHTAAGYYIQAWQEITGQVRTMLAADPRFQAIRARRNSHAI